MQDFLARVLDRQRKYIAESFLLGAHESALVDAMHKLDTLRASGSLSVREYEILKANILRRAGEHRPPEASPN